ncbi:MAG TPA: hypothetical protein VLX58_22450 [Bryobacteraceae bacterium]|nr:hypothetical protein [Bryobacteraceae bacterium]
MRISTIRSAVGAGLLLFSLAAISFAQRHGREYLGEANVDGAVDHDNIVVTAAKGTFRAIQIRVERAAIEFDRVVVHYGDGDSEPIHIRSRIPRGGETRIIDLPGGSRVIRSVEFWYARASGRPEKPKVRLFGFR